MKFTAPLVITVVYLILAFVLLLMMGMELIHNQKVIDRLLITIPVTGAALIAYWFSKMSQNGKGNGGPSPTS